MERIKHGNVLMTIDDENKQEALEKFWKDCDIDAKNKKDIEEGYKPRTKRQFRVFDVEQELNGEGKTLGVW